MKIRIGILLFLLLSVLSCAAMAEEAQDITAQCAITRDGRKLRAPEMQDRDYRTYFAMGARSNVEFTAEEDISGVFVQFHDHCTECAVQVPAGDDWREITVLQEPYLTQWVPLPEGTRSFRLHNNTGSRVYLNEVTVYGSGDQPKAVHTWRSLTSADLMLLVAHPDDELLWFGGLLPTYAGERKLDVQVVYFCPTSPMRRLELLDGLWTCGVTAYPGFLMLRDSFTSTLRDMYRVWDQGTVWRGVTRVIRQYRPKVLVTQDFNGEYGHGAHRAAADSAVQCIQLAADETAFPDSAEAWGTWQVQKLYIHLYEERQLHLDWHQPLSSFGGKDAYEVAVEALACHKSQVKRGWEMTDGGEKDNSLFGLYFTAVGDDVAGNDLMEHIDLDRDGGMDD